MSKVKGERVERRTWGCCAMQGNRDNELKRERRRYRVRNRVECPQINNKLQNPKQIHRLSHGAESEHGSRYFCISARCNYCCKPRAVLYKREKLKLLRPAF